MDRASSLSIARTGFYAGKDPQGRKGRPDLPVRAADAVFELVVNLNTAKALGLTVPPSISRPAADEVIE